MITRHRKKIQQKIYSRRCTICLEYITPKTRISICCGVQCHKRCLLKWLRINPQCPLCKRDIEKSDALDFDYEENYEKNLCADIQKHLKK